MHNSILNTMLANSLKLRQKSMVAIHDVMRSLARTESPAVLFEQVWDLESLQCFVKILPDSIDLISQSSEFKWAELCLIIEPFISEEKIEKVELV